MLMVEIWVYIIISLEKEYNGNLLTVPLKRLPVIILAQTWEWLYMYALY